MAKKYLDYDGLLYFWQKIKTMFVTDVTYTTSSRKIQKTKAGTTSDVVTLSKVATSNSYTDLDNRPTIPEGVEPTTTTPKMDGTAAVGSETKFARGDHVHPSDTSKVDKVDGKGLSTNDFTDTLKTKLDGIASGAEVNQNAFSNVTVGSTTIQADSKTDTLTLTAGSNITLTPNATSDSITIAATNTTYSAGTKALIEAGTDTSNRVWQAKILADYVKAQIQTAVTGAASFQGTAPSPFAPTGYKKGYYWVVGTAGTYAGQVCEPGDMIFAVSDYGTAYADADFNVIQTNLDITSITNAEIDTIVAS